MYWIHAVCMTHTGRKRKRNEDNFYFDGTYLAVDHGNLEHPLATTITSEETACFAVFDGLGGEAHGELASFCAAAQMKKTMRKPDVPDQIVALWERTCFEMNQAVCEKAKLRCENMGSTVAGICFHQENGYVCNVGDSKVFLCRENTLRQLSFDHTDAALLRQLGMTARKPRLLQYLGIAPDKMLLEPYIAPITLQYGDRFLICSDGLTDMVSESCIEKTLVNSFPAEDTVATLMELALTHGGVDNITMMICDIDKLGE